MFYGSPVGEIELGILSDISTLGRRLGTVEGRPFRFVRACLAQDGRLWSVGWSRMWENGERLPAQSKWQQG